jgi:2,5-diketo-D-gluconate reductase A
MTHDLSNTAGWAERTVLKDGRSMPLLGLGTQYGWSEDGHDRGSLERAHEHVALGLRTGFRLIDTARCYGTEAGVLRGVEASGIARHDVFVISKAWPGVDHPPGLDSSRAAIAESAAHLGGHVDLYLVHHPVPGWQELWRALEEARDNGLVRSIGVSNFRPEQLDELAHLGRHAPVANEIHLHPFIAGDHAATLRRCAADHVVVIAFPRSPWQAGQGTVVDEIAREVGRTRAQVMLRWAVEHGHAVVPLSTDEGHLRENLAVHEFRLTPAQISTLDGVHGISRPTARRAGAEPR